MANVPAIAFLASGILAAQAPNILNALNTQKETAQSEPAQVVVQEAPKPTAEQLEWCGKYGVLPENCVNVHTSVKNGEPVVGINYFGDRRESYSDHLASQQQRKADLEYCAENRTDWSCSEGQYAGQY